MSGGKTSLGRYAGLLRLPGHINQIVELFFLPIIPFACEMIIIQRLDVAEKWL